MRFISTKIHGILDYLIGLLLVSGPWLFNYNYGGAETWISVAIGILIILYSALTDYELGIIRLIPMKARIIMDAMVGFFLAISPWLFGFSQIVYIPHVVIGMGGLTMIMFSKPAPEPVDGFPAGDMDNQI